jgi:hypothetical protein
MLWFVDPHTTLICIGMDCFWEGGGVSVRWGPWSTEEDTVPEMRGSETVSTAQSQTQVRNIATHWEKPSSVILHFDRTLSFVAFTTKASHRTQSEICFIPRRYFLTLHLSITFRHPFWLSNLKITTGFDVFRTPYVVRLLLIARRQPWKCRNTPCWLPVTTSLPCGPHLNAHQ